MSRAGPRKVHAYSREFKLTAVRLSQQPGMQVQAVAAALDIHAFMLSKWRIEQAHALLPEEHELQGKEAVRFCSARKPTSSRSSTRSAGGTRACGVAESEGRSEPTSVLNRRDAQPALGADGRSR